jgi:small GTP-binding protein
MGLIISRLWESLFSRGEVKVVVVGLDNAGKTTTLYKLLLGEVVVTNPTIGSNVEEIQYKNLKFQMWDIGGQESLRLSWSTYYTHTSCVIMVIDSTDVARMDLAKTELKKIVTHEDLSSVSILILANKQDLKKALTPSQLSERLDLSSIKDHQWHIQGCCALTGDGLMEGLDWIVAQVKDKT